MLKKLISVCVVIFSITNFALAESDEVKNFVTKLSQDALSLIKDKSISDEDKEKKLEDLFRKSVDINWIGRFSLGRYAKTLQKNELEEFSKTYEAYLIHSYVPNFKKYTVNDLDIQSISNTGNNEFVVKTSVNAEGFDQPISVDYKIRKKSSESYVVIDIIAEGISLINTQRADFTSVIGSNGIDFLIESLKKKATERLAE